MTGSRNWPYHIGTALVVAVFISYKWQFLGLPLYWDEAWVYGPAVRAMNANGISLLPNTIGPDLSRGHPLLFHVLASTWSLPWGESNTSLHAFALFVSVSLLALVYMVGSKFGSPQIGLAAILLLGCNEIFIAQSAILLPEVLLGLFMLLAVRTFVSKHIVGYIVTSTCALFVKESALVMILALLCWQAVSILADKSVDQLKHHLKWVVITLFPIVPAFLFLLYQRTEYGWFLYPTHLELVSLNIKDVHYLFKFGYRELFEQQGMEIATLAFGLIAPLAWKGWNKRYTGVLVVLLYVTAIKVLDGKWTLPPLQTLIVTLACFSMIMFLQFIPLWKKEGARGEFASISLILVLGFLLFSALNFFSDRYLVGLIPFIALSMSTVFYSAFAPRHWVVFPSAILVITTVLFWQIGKDDRVGDTRISYQNDISAHLEVVREIENLNLHEAIIYSSFVDIAYLTDLNAGYLQEGRVFRHVSNSLTDTTQYAIVSRGDPSDIREHLLSLGFVLRRRFQSGPAWCELYERQLQLGGINNSDSR